MTTLDDSPLAHPRGQRARVFHDPNRGGWCWQLPGRQPVQAESWAHAWVAVHGEIPPATGVDVETTPAAPAPPVRWWRRFILS